MLSKLLINKAMKFISALQQCLKIKNQSQYLEILKTNHRSITIFGIIHHVNIKQLEYFLDPLVRTKQKLKNTRVLLKWAKLL